MYHLQAFKSSKLNLAHKMSMTDHHISRCSTIHYLNKIFQKPKRRGRHLDKFRSPPRGHAPFMSRAILPKKKGEAGLAAMLASLHLPWSTCLLNVIMLEEVGPQKHGLDISLKLIAGLKDTLERCISLVSMPCIKDLVVGVYPGLQRFQLEAKQKMHTHFKTSTFRDLPVFCSQ